MGSGYRFAAVKIGASSPVADAMSMTLCFRSNVLGGKDRLDAGTRERLSLVDRRDFGMGVRRAQEHGVELPRQHDVMDIASATGEEASIFTTAKPYPDPIFGHCDVSSA